MQQAYTELFFKYFLTFFPIVLLFVLGFLGHRYGSVYLWGGKSGLIGILIWPSSLDFLWFFGSGLTTINAKKILYPIRNGYMDKMLIKILVMPIFPLEAFKKFKKLICQPWLGLKIKIIFW